MVLGHSDMAHACKSPNIGKSSHGCEKELHFSQGFSRLFG